jgi:hypothetical protein
MPVGLHEAIHDAGLKPNTMNSGAQTMPVLCEAIHGL